MFALLWHIGHGWFAQVNQHSNKRKTTLGRHYLDAAPPMGLNRLHTKINHRFSTNHTLLGDNRHHNNNSSDNTNDKNIFLVVPYTRAPRESFKKTCSNLGIHILFKGSNTHPKEGVIYQNN